MKKAQLVLVDGRGMTADALVHPLFGDERMEKLKKLRAENIRLDSAAAELAYLCALDLSFGKIERNLYAYGENDKPYFADETLGFLSIAHAGGVGACIVSDAPVGCDTELKERDVSRISKRIYFEDCPEKEDALPLWCIKESFVKLTGEGLLRPFSALLYKDGEVCRKDGKILSKAKWGEIKDIVWAVSGYQDMKIETRLINAFEALERIKKQRPG